VTGTRAADEQATPPVEPAFRERALGDPPNPLEHIDHLFHHTSWRIWLGVLGLTVLLGAGVLWTAVAHQTVSADGEAVIVPPKGIFTAGDFQEGVVRLVLVGEHTEVEADQPLAAVELPDGRLVNVRSPVAGRVLSIEIRVGESSPPGNPMFKIAPLDERPMAIALFPAATISRLAPGQPVAITVNGVAPERFGKAVGRVAAIGPVPASRQRLRQLTGDASLLGLADRLGAVREVRIALTPARTPSGLAWTSGSGPPSPLPIGVRAVAGVTVARETLIGKAFG
jgi:multidrug efflux pump subunit AcrA (membrane-fusion protein)